MPKSKEASTTSNSKASGPKRKRHPPSEERPIPKGQDTVPLLPLRLNADSEAPSVTPADNAVAPSQGISMHSVNVLQTQLHLVIMLIKPQGKKLFVGNMYILRSPFSSRSH